MTNREIYWRTELQTARRKLNNVTSTGAVHKWMNRKKECERELRNQGPLNLGWDGDC